MEPGRPMQRGSQRGAIVACAVIAAVTVGVAVWWSVRDSGDAVRVVPPEQAISHPSPSSPAARGEDATTRQDTDGSLSDVAAQRSAQEWSPLTLPSEEELAALDASDRLLLVGRVLGFDGAPCPGAEIWRAGQRIATSDAAGCYRVEIDQRAPFHGEPSHPPWRALVAVKEGVGAGSAKFGERSARLDLPLKWRTRLTGHTVVAGNRSVVPHARVELAVFDLQEFGMSPWWRVETTSDADGAFEFVGLPPTAVALRATAEEFQSAGWFVRSVGESDQLRFDFQLTRRVAIRGRFTPWPPYDGAVVADARVVALPTRSGDVALEMEKLETAVAADGAFELPIGESFDCGLHLVIGSGSLWRAAVEVPEGGGVVDLGVVALPASAWIDLEVALPRELLELGVVASLLPEGDHGLGWTRWPIPVGGHARLGPFEARRLQLWVGLRDDATRWSSPDQVILDEGEVVPLKWTPQFGKTESWLIGGRVTHGAGVPSPSVGVWIVVPGEKRDYAYGTHTDRQGSWLLDVPHFEGSIARGRSIELVARGKAGVARRVVTASLPAAGANLRLDVALEPGATLRGTVVDAAGAPCTEASFSLRTIGSNGKPWAVSGMDLLLDAAGAFTVPSLELRDYEARVHDGEKWHDLGRVRPGGEAVTLKLEGVVER